PTTARVFLTQCPSATQGLAPQSYSASFPRRPPEEFQASELPWKFARPRRRRIRAHLHSKASAIPTDTAAACNEASECEVTACDSSSSKAFVVLGSRSSIGAVPIAS